MASSQTPPFQHALEIENPFFQLALEASPSGMLVVDREGRIVFANSQIEKLFGYTREELRGQSVEILVPHRFREEHPQYRQNFVAKPEVRNMGGRELFAVTIEGKEIPVEIGLRPLHTSGGLYVVAAVVDISQRKKLESQKDAFVSTISHEIQTPLAILKMALENFQESNLELLDEKQRRVIQICSDHTQRLTHLITDILDLSKLESRKVTPHFSFVDLKELIERFVKSVLLFFQEKQIAFQQELPAEPIYIWADLIMIERVLNNLLSNAARFAKQEAKINVSTDEETVTVSVIDDGPGIPLGEQGRLFNKFEQIHRSKGGGGYQGTGLGLALCKEIIDLHQGKIGVESKVGGGSRFYFTLLRQPPVKI